MEMPTARCVHFQRGGGPPCVKMLMDPDFGPGLSSRSPRSDSDSSRSDDDEVWSSSLRLATTILIAVKGGGGAVERREWTHKGVPTINVIKSKYY